jgi:hypothetical protein
MKLRIKYSSRLVPKGYKAWVLYPFMIFSQQQKEVADTLFRHELQHVYQVRRDGWFKFYGLYLWRSLWDGYLNNTYEVEARYREDTPLTNEERALKDE